MTDSSMRFGPAWIRNLRSEGTATAGGGTAGGTRYQLAEYRYGREEMLALFDKCVKPPSPLTNFKTLYSETTLMPLALLPTTEEEQRSWQNRPTTIGGANRGRGGSLERGGRVSRGRGVYQAYGRATSAFDGSWGNGEQPEWSPRKEFTRQGLQDNWRRVRNNEEEEGWRNIGSARPLHEKWGRSTSWRGEGDNEERNGPPERGGVRASWHEGNRGAPMRRSWENEDHLPEWATENPTEGGGTFDERGAFHGSDDEQDFRTAGGRKDSLQKSMSQQQISNKNNPQAPGLASSKSATSLSKSAENNKPKEIHESDEIIQGRENLRKLKEAHKESLNTAPNEIPPKIDKKSETSNDPRRNHDESEQYMGSGGGSRQEHHPSQHEHVPENLIFSDRVEEDFERLQEDLVLKLVVDEETPKHNQPYDVSGVAPPPNLVPPSQEKWYYQDPQGTRQGPFTNMEMAEWFKAGYFNNHLNIMRDCDERYCLLGDLLNVCGGENPFLSNIRFPVMKSETPKLPDDMLPYQYLSQLAFKQQVSMRSLQEPWAALTLQQQELAAQRLLMQQQQQQPPTVQAQMEHQMQYMPQNPQANPLLYMISQMQQGNKMPGPVMPEKPASNVPNHLDPLLVQMGNLHPLQNRLQNPAMQNHMPGGLPGNHPGSLPPENMGNPLPNLQSPNMPSMSAIHGNMPGSRPMEQQQPPVGPETDPITNFLRHFKQQQQQQQPPPQQQQQQQQQQQRQIPLDALWQKQNQFGAPPGGPASQWPPQEQGPLLMWDMQSTENQHEANDKEGQDESLKDVKKRKELEEKQSKKDAEEKRRQEQRKQEADKKAAEDKKKKEEERIRKELDKAKKEAEDKRMRELEEKRRLKEQRKAEEDARKKAEELKKIEDEKARREKEDNKKHAESSRLSQIQVNKSASKTAPWSQSNSTAGMSLQDIQRAEREKRAQDAALQLQRQQIIEQQQQQQQQQSERNNGLQFNWAKKPIEQRKEKSFAEIQEEQERLAKLAAEARVNAQMKEKEVAPQMNTSAGIWNGQSLTWASATATASSQWSSNAAGGFWEDVSSKTANKPSTVTKSHSVSGIVATKQPASQQPSQKQQQPQQQQQSKAKQKKEEPPKAANNNNNQTKDEFTDWCYKTLSNMSANVDIPTFVTFLRDIESAYDVRDYCKEYLGESSATQQFALSFLEKRRSFKPRNNAHKDDMCSPAPAITPSTQHSTEFQEVKGKNKKNKKSKMLKVDARILGFNVTSAPDRINVGDRDYGDNS